jgi:hypothetical protein
MMIEYIQLIVMTDLLGKDVSIDAILLFFMLI